MTCTLVCRSSTPSNSFSWRGWQNTVGSLIEFVWLKQIYHGPQLAGMCVNNREGMVSSNLRFQTALYQQYSANLSYNPCYVKSRPRYEPRCSPVESRPRTTPL